MKVAIEEEVDDNKLQDVPLDEENGGSSSNKKNDNTSKVEGSTVVLYCQASDALLLRLSDRRTYTSIKIARVTIAFPW